MKFTNLYIVYLAILTISLVTYNADQNANSEDLSTKSPSDKTTLTSNPARTSISKPITTVSSINPSTSTQNSSTSQSTTTHAPNTNTTTGNITSSTKAHLSTQTPYSTSTKAHLSTKTPYSTSTAHNLTTLAPPNHSNFSALSFFCGMVVSAVLIGLVYFAYRFYRSRQDRNYQQF